MRKALSLGDFLSPLCEISIKHSNCPLVVLLTPNAQEITPFPGGLPSKDFIFCFTDYD